MVGVNGSRQKGDCQRTMPRGSGGCRRLRNLALGEGRQLSIIVRRGDKIMVGEGWTGPGHEGTHRVGVRIGVRPARLQLYSC